MRINRNPPKVTEICYFWKGGVGENLWGDPFISSPLISVCL